MAETPSFNPMKRVKKKKKKKSDFIKEVMKGLLPMKKSKIQEVFLGVKNNKIF